MAQDHKVGDSKARNAAKSSRLLANEVAVPETSGELFGQGDCIVGDGRSKRSSRWRRVCLLALLSLGEVATGQGTNARKSFEDGQAALQRGDLDAAERDFKSVLAVDPKAGPAYTNLGVIAMRRKNWDEAVRLLRKAERLQPNEPGIRLNLGLVEYTRGNYPDAIAPLERVVKEKPDSVQARYLLGLSYSFVERHADAVKVLEQLWPQMSDQFVYLYVLGISAFYSKNEALDQKAMTRLIEVGGDTPQFHLLMGKALLGRSDVSAFAGYETGRGGVSKRHYGRAGFAFQPRTTGEDLFEFRSGRAGAE